MPRNAGGGFRYRTSLKRGARPETYALYLLLIVVSVSVLVTLTARAIGPLLASEIVLGIIIIVSLLGAVFNALATDQRMVRASPLEQFLPLLLIGPLTWVVFRAGTYTGFTGLAGSLPLLVTAICLAYLADRLITHHLHWLAADPNVREEESAALLSAWSERWRIWKDFGRKDEARNKAIAVVHVYRVRLMIFTVAVLFGLLAFATVSVSRGWGRPAAGMVSIVVVLFLLGLNESREGFSAWRVVWNSCVNWLTYNMQDSKAPGVLQSPGGTHLRRLVTASLVVFIAFFSLLPMAFYFPAGLLAGSSDRWARAAQKTDYMLTWGQTPRIQGLPTYEEVERTLNTSQHNEYRRLGSTEERERFLDAVAYRVQLTGGNEARFDEALSSRLAERPESWLVVSMTGIASGDAAILFWLILSILLSVAVPLGFLGYGVQFVAGMVFRSATDALVPPETALRPATAWQVYVRRLRTLGEEAKNHLWLGSTVLGDEPVFLDCHVLHEHAHILGDTGSGKTSRALAPLVNQLISRAKGEEKDGEGNGHSIVVLDLKGDPSFFAGARTAAHIAGIPFKWFTTESGLPTYVFNPFLQEAMGALTAVQKAENMLKALGMEHGEGYGRSHFTKENRIALLRVFQHDQVLARDPEASERRVLSFRAVHEVLQDKALHQLTKKQLEDASELTSSVEMLQSFDALNIDPWDVRGGRVEKAVLDEAISMQSVLETPQVVYFHLPSLIGAASVKEVGKLALYSLLSAAARHERLHRKAGRVYLIIDEFQQIVSEGIQIILQQARSKGIAAILANQTISDLRTPTANLIPVVQANTRFKQYFSAQDLDEQDALIQSSGEALYDVTKVLEPEDPIRDDRVEWQEQLLGKLAESWGRLRDLRVMPRLTRNDIIEMSNNADQCIVHINRGTGLSQFGGYPFMLRTEFHVTYNRYRKWSEKAWPRARAGTITPPLAKTDPPVPANRARKHAQAVSLWTQEKKNERRKKILKDDDDV